MNRSKFIARNHIEDHEDYETIDEARNEIKRLRGLLKRVLDSASPQKRWDVLMLEIEKEVGDE